MNLEVIKRTAVKNRVPLVIFLVSFVFYAYIAYCAPLTVDDLEFSGYNFNFSEMLNYVLYYGNGRFLGNLFALIFVHSGYFQIFFRAFSLSALIILIPRTLQITSNTSYLVSFLLITGMFPRIFAQVYSSLCTFGNYVPPILITLIIINIYRDSFNLSTANRRIMTVVTFFLGISGQLYMENNTVYNVFLATLSVVYSSVKKRDTLPVALAWFLSTSLGSIIMFAIPRIFYVPNNLSVGYREFLGGSFSEIAYTAVDNFVTLYDILISNHLAIITLFIVALIILHFDYAAKRMQPLLLLLGLVTVISYFFDLGFWDGSIAKLQKFMVIVRNLSFIMVAITIIYSSSSMCQKHRIALLLIFFVVSLAPLLVVSPIGERLSFLAYIHMVSIILIGIDTVQQKLTDKTIAAIRKSICALAFALCFMLTCLFTYINYLDSVRQTHIDSEMLKQPEEIHIFLIPSNYVLGGATVSYERRYYHEEWGDIEIIIDDINTWMSLYRTNE